MYWKMMRIFKPCTGSSVVKKTSSVIFAACIFAKWKYQQTVPILNDNAWLDSLKSKYEARCQGTDKTNSSKKKASSTDFEATKKDTVQHDESKITNPPKNEIRIIIIGSTAHGLSTTASSLLQKKTHMPWCFAEGTVLKTIEREIDSCVCKIDIIDTPPVTHYSKIPDTNKLYEIYKAIALSCPGPHAIILCIPAKDMSLEIHTDAIKPYENIFGDEVYDFIIVAFTNFDKYDGKGSASKQKNKTKFNQDLKKAITKNKSLKKIKNIEKRHICLQISERMTPEENSEKLKQVIDIIRKRGKFVTCDLSEYVETELQKKMNEPKPSETKKMNLKESGNKPTKHTRQADKTTKGNPKASIDTCSNDTTAEGQKTSTGDNKRDTVKTSKTFLDNIVKTTC